MTYHVLMVCTGNICRSPIAEVMLRHMLPDTLKKKVVVSSAGVSGLDGNRATKEAVSVMEDAGIDLAGHCARFLTLEILKEADFVIVMEQAHERMIENFYRSEKNKVRMLSEFCPEKKKKDVPDPYGQSMRAYKKSADMIERCMAGVIEYLEELNL